MKDALGHGSDPHGNAAAADVLSGGHPKSIPVPDHPAMGRDYWGAAKVGNKLVQTAPTLTRTAARDAARTLLTGRSARRGVVSTGYGKYGPHFDIRWHSRDEK